MILRVFMLTFGGLLGLGYYIALGYEAYRLLDPLVSGIALLFLVLMLIMRFSRRRRSQATYQESETC